MLPHLFQRLFRHRQVSFQLVQMSQRLLFEQQRLVAHGPEVHVVQSHAVPQPCVLYEGLKVHDAVGEVGEHRRSVAATPISVAVD